MTAENLIVEDSTIALSESLKEFTNRAFEGKGTLNELNDINYRHVGEIGILANQWLIMFCFLVQALEGTQLKREKALKEFPKRIYGECYGLLYIFNSGADWLKVGLSEHLQSEFGRISNELGIKPKEIKLEQFVQLVLNGDFILIPTIQKKL